MNNEADLKAWRRWWINTADQAESTIDEYLKHVRAYLTAYGDTPSLRTGKEYVNDVIERSGRQVGTWAWRALRSYGKWLEEVEGESPTGLMSKQFANCKPAPSTVNKNHAATTDDIGKLLATCRTDDQSFYDIRDQAIISVLASTGARVSEVARMEWGHVTADFDAFLIPITKTKKVRTVRLSEAAQDALRRYQRVLKRQGVDVPHVWVGYGLNHQLTRDGIRLMLRARSQRAGVAVTSHCFRRGLAVQWVDKGGSETNLKRFMGWSDRSQMVARYTQSVKEQSARNEHERLFA